MKEEAWISVKDRLPEPITCVLVWKNTSLRADYAYYFNNNEWLLFDEYGNYWNREQPHIKVLFWQPLPEPPAIERIKEMIS